MEEQAKGLVPSLQAAALLVDPPWVVVNNVWGEWWWSDWELVLWVVGEHAGEVLVLVLLMVGVLVLLAYR